MNSSGFLVGFVLSGILGYANPDQEALKTISKPAPDYKIINPCKYF